MKFYTILYLGEVGQHVQETFSESQIIESYWDHWSEKMRTISADPSQVSQENCIKEWIVIHTAYESDMFGNWQGDPKDLVNYEHYDLSTIHKTSKGNLL